MSIKPLDDKLMLWQHDLNNSESGNRKVKSAEITMHVVALRIHEDMMQLGARLDCHTSRQALYAYAVKLMGASSLLMRSITLFLIEAIVSSFGGNRIGSLFANHAIAERQRARSASMNSEQEYYWRRHRDRVRSMELTQDGKIIITQRNGIAHSKQMTIEQQDRLERQLLSIAARGDQPPDIK